MSKKPKLDRGLLMTPFPLYELVIVDHGDYRHYGEILSRITPTDTYMVRMVPGHPGTLREMPASKLIERTMSPRIRWVHYAAVNGHGSFPIDMLRYDYCAPLNFDPETKVIDPVFGTTDYVVCRASHNRYPTWTDARWASFLWGVRHLHTDELRHADS